MVSASIGENSEKSSVEFLKLLRHISRGRGVLQFFFCAEIQEGQQDQQHAA
jgi:hypothetical protein